MGKISFKDGVVAKDDNLLSSDEDCLGGSTECISVYTRCKEEDDNDNDGDGYGSGGGGDDYPPQPDPDPEEDVPPAPTASCVSSDCDFIEAQTYDFEITNYEDKYDYSIVFIKGTGSYSGGNSFTWTMPEPPTALADITASNSTASTTTHKRVPVRTCKPPPPTMVLEEGDTQVVCGAWIIWRITNHVEGYTYDFVVEAEGISPITTGSVTMLSEDTFKFVAPSREEGTSINTIHVRAKSPDCPTMSDDGIVSAVVEPCEALPSDLTVVPDALLTLYQCGGPDIYSTTAFDLNTNYPELKIQGYYTVLSHYDKINGKDISFAGAFAGHGHRVFLCPRFEGQPLELYDGGTGHSNWLYINTYVFDPLIEDYRKFSHNIMVGVWCGYESCSSTPQY